MTENPVTDITITYNVALITVDNLPGNLKWISDIFNSIADEHINVDMINQTPSYRGTTSISFSILSADLVKTLGILNRFKRKLKDIHIEVDADNTKLSVHGEHMRNIPGVAAKLYTLLASSDIEVKLVTTSEVDILYLIYEKDVDKALDAIKKEFQFKLEINPV